jgi:LmbE family N-acetylglucosaminyl deacetylase
MIQAQASGPRTGAHRVAMAGNAPKDVYLFVLAHPDDEIAFAPLLDRLARERKPVRLIYLTDGAARGASAAVRQRETLAGLQYLGFDSSAAFFAGSEHGIPDGLLCRHLDAGLMALETWAANWKSVAEIHSFAWEGGHPDHDAALVVAAAFAVTRGLEAHVWQVPFYRASDRWPAPLFTLGDPLAENGEAVSLRLSASERRLPAELIRFYPSQWRSFVGLAPFILWRSLTRSNFAMQRLDPRRLRERPAKKLLLYGKRDGVTVAELVSETARFLDAHASARRKSRPTPRRVGAA